MQPLLQYHVPRLRTLCRRYRIRHLWAVGSVLRDDFSPKSDVDLLYEWDRPSIADEAFLANYEGFQHQVTQTLGRQVDFILYQRLRNPFLIEEFDRTKVLIYAKASEEILGGHVALHS